MIETKKIKCIESYFEGIKSAIACIENNLWNDNSIASSCLDCTKDEWKELKEQLLEIKQTRDLKQG